MLLCHLFGHHGARSVHNAGLVFARCLRCDRDLVRVRGGRWYPVPCGMIVRWSPVGRHAVPVSEVLVRARREAPILHRLRRRPRESLRFYN